MHWLTGCTHFDHEGILRHTDRPFATVGEMNDALIANWNRVVGKKDAVFILGDFAWRRPAHFMAALHGKKFVLPGNHDSPKLLREIALCAVVLQERIAKIRFEGDAAIISHYALRTWVGKRDGVPNFYAHSHGRLPEYADVPQCEVGVDVWDYTPVSWLTLKLKLGAVRCKPRRPDADIRAAVAALLLVNRQWRISTVKPMEGEKSGYEPTTEHCNEVRKDRVDGQASVRHPAGGQEL